MKQTASTILMIRPASFGFNAETAANNVFQGTVPMAEKQIQETAVEEFDAFVEALRSRHVKVWVVNDTPLPPKPDALFPNNWFCTLPDGTLATFPMQAANRRTEVRSDLIQMLKDNFVVSSTEDWTRPAGATPLYLEGTGSLIFDHPGKIAYACLSPRTSKALLHRFCIAHRYTPVSFTATDDNGVDIYHTNVIMHVGQGYAVVCLASIRDDAERSRIIDSLQKTGHSIIDITLQQVYAYAGNMLQVMSADGSLYTVLSCLAYDSLTEEQRDILARHTQLLPVKIPTIETVGGGSVRCMMAEIFLEEK